MISDEYRSKLRTIEYSGKEIMEGGDGGPRCFVIDEGSHEKSFRTLEKAIDYAWEKVSLEVQSIRSMSPEQWSVLGLSAQILLVRQNVDDQEDGYQS